jgi:hypothetical protein
LNNLFAVIASELSYSNHRKKACVKWREYLSPNFINRNIRSYIIITNFTILSLLSIQPAFLEFTERDLAYHIVMELSLFSFLGVLSVQVAEIILKHLVPLSTDRKTDLKGTLSLSWTRFLRTIFSVNRYD